MGVLSNMILAKLAQNVGIERLLADDTVVDIALDHLANELIVRNAITIVDSNRDLEANVELVLQVEAVEPRFARMRLPDLRRCNIRRRLAKVLLPSNPKHSIQIIICRCRTRCPQ